MGDKRIHSNISTKLTYFSFFFSVIVILGHLMSFSEYSPFLLKVKVRYVAFFVSMIMGYFFFISGYLFYRDYTGIDSFIKKFKSRIQTLAIPYFLWNLLVLAEKIFFEYRKAGTVTMDISLDYFLLDGGSGISEPINGPTWYIARLLTYVLAAPILWELIKRKKVWIASVIILLFYNVLINYSNVMSFLYNLLFYLLGAGIGVHYDKQFEKMCVEESKKQEHWFIGIVKVILVTAPLFLVFFADHYIEGDMGVMLRQIMHIVNRTAAPFLFFYCFRQCHFKKKYPILNYSFFLYASQGFWFVLLREIPMYQFSEEQLAWVKWGMILVLDLVIIFVCRRFKLTSKLMDILCGARTKR